MCCQANNKNQIDMKNKLIIIILFCMVSCKNYLQEDLVSGVSYDYYDTETGLETAVNAAYSEMRAPLGNETYFTLGDYGTDTYTEAVDGGNKAFNRYATGLNSSQGMLHDLWTWYYRGINTANLCIERIPTIPGVNIYKTEDDRNKRIGEMKFLRAYYYFMLVQTFGKVPLETSSNLEVKTDYKRAPVADIYRQIIEDLRYAVEHLPPTQTDNGRAHKAAAQHLLAKVYLTRGSAVTEQRGQLPTDIDSAAYFAEEVINNSTHTLEPDYATIWKPGNERNRESIFVISFSKNPLFNGNGNTLHLYFQMIYEGADSPGGMTRDVANGRPWRRLRPTDYLLDVYNRRIDSRFYKSYKMVFYCNHTDVPTWSAQYAPTPDLVGKPKFGLGDTAIYLTLNTGVTPDEIGRRPYSWIPRNAQTTKWFPTLNKHLDPGRPDKNATAGVRDFILMRLGETYLIAAEAYARDNNFDKAAELVNVLRKRAAYKEGELKTKEFYTVEGGNIADLLKSTEEEMKVTPAQISANMLEFFMDERARELNGEQWRWFDLVRVEKLEERVKKYNAAASNIRPFHKLRPIPQNHIDRLTNPGSPEEEQNEGYY